MGELFLWGGGVGMRLRMGLDTWVDQVIRRSERLIFSRGIRIALLVRLLLVLKWHSLNWGEAKCTQFRMREIRAQGSA